MSEYTLDWLVGDELAAVEAEKSGRWTFKFRSGGVLVVECPWRLLERETIRISSADHLQQYGLPAALDSAAEVMKVLRASKVRAVDVSQTLGDLTLAFEPHFRLQIVPFSSGYEAWESISPKASSA